MVRQTATQSDSTPHRPETATDNDSGRKRAQHVRHDTIRVGGKNRRTRLNNRSGKHYLLLSNLFPIPVSTHGCAHGLLIYHPRNVPGMKDIKTTMNFSAVERSTSHETRPGQDHQTGRDGGGNT